MMSRDSRTFHMRLIFSPLLGSRTSPLLGVTNISMCLTSFDEISATTKGKEQIALTIALCLCLAPQRHRKLRKLLGVGEKEQSIEEEEKKGGIVKHHHI